MVTRLAIDSVAESFPQSGLLKFFKSLLA